MCSHTRGERAREDVWTERAREEAMERDSETLPGCRSSATLDWCECAHVSVCDACVCVLWALAMAATIASAIRDACFCNVL